MPQHLAHVALLVRDYDEAIAYYVETLGFRLVEDTPMSPGGRVFLFLRTDDFARDHEAYRARGVRFIEAPRDEAYGRVVVFEDLYGNRWDLVEPRIT